MNKDLPLGKATGSTNAKTPVSSLAVSRHRAGRALDNAGRLRRGTISRRERRWAAGGGAWDAGGGGRLARVIGRGAAEVASPAGNYLSKLQREYLQIHPYYFSYTPLIWIAINNRDPNIFKKPILIFQLPPNLDRDY